METNTDNSNNKKVPKPSSQKSIYHSFADVYHKLMNGDIPVDKAEQAVNALGGMNRTYALELKRAELERSPKMRTIEIISTEEEESLNK